MVNGSAIPAASARPAGMMSQRPRRSQVKIDTVASVIPANIVTRKRRRRCR